MLEYLNMITAEHITTTGLLLLVYAIGYSLWRSHRSRDIDFNLLDLVMEGGRVSKISVIIIVAFVLHSWVIVTLTLSKTVTETSLLSYAGVWVTPLLTRMVFGAHQPPPPPTSPPSS